MLTCTWDRDIFIADSSWPDEGEVMTIKTNHSISANIFPSCSPLRISKRKIRIGKKITKKILANPKEGNEITIGLAEIERGDFVVWKKKHK